MNLVLAVIVGCAAVFALAYLIAFWRVCEDKRKRIAGVQEGLKR